MVDKTKTWEEIKAQFPNEWVALAPYERTGPYAVCGTIVAHHQEKLSLHQTVKDLMPSLGKIAVRYTGELIRHAETPLLWQILPTN